MTSPLSSMQPAHTRLMHRGDPTRPVQAPRTTTKGEVTGGDGELSLSLSPHGFPGSPTPSDGRHTVAIPRCFPPVDRDGEHQGPMAL
jgi:hypothetical protein